MIQQKEFYFVRHGQTNYNLLEGINKGDHPYDIPLLDRFNPLSLNCQLKQFVQAL